jgi:hypothetical protein
MTAVTLERMPVSRRSFASGVACGLAGSLARAFVPAAKNSSKLLILLIAEQFRPDYLERAETRLAPGGFRRLLSEASYFPDCRFAASTFTASGLATIMTGAWPDVHGVIADSWYDRASQKEVSADVLALEATTLAEPLAGRGRIFTAALDESHASLLAGSALAQSFWMDDSGQITSGPSAPPWLAEFNRQHPMESLRDTRWLAMGAGPGVPPLRTLSFDPRRPEDFLLLVHASPFGQAAQFDLLREIIQREQAGQSDSIDVVAVSLGSLARLGYEVGADSPLMDQMVLQLDHQIEITLEMLQKAVGAGNYTLVFTGAHGAPAEPDESRRKEMAVAGEAVARAINAGLSAQFSRGEPGWYVERYVYPFLYLHYDELRRRGIDARQARGAAGRVALQAPGVAAYYTADDECSQRGGWQQRFRNSFHARRSGDLMLSYLPEYVEEFGAGRGISYGSLYNYDASVPLLLYGPPFRAATFQHSVDAVDIAPTLARSCHLSLPSSATGRVLAEALLEGTPRRR